MRSAADTERICERTGLALVAGPDHAYRIARASFGPLAPKPRGAADDAAEWSRFDTVGRTIYAAESRVTSFMELLAPYRTEVSRQRRALQTVADAMGIELEELWRQVVADWDESGRMKATWLPRAFREGRMVYELQFPAGWWVEITATETISALGDLMGESGLTLSHITGDDRGLTTAIATALREHIELDDGSLPLGIRFTSKHGRPTGESGRCWAYWLRSVDNGLAEPARVVSAQAIPVDDPDLLRAQRLCKIRSR